MDRTDGDGAKLSGAPSSAGDEPRSGSAILKAVRRGAPSALPRAAGAASGEPGRLGLAGRLISLAGRGGSVRWERVEELRDAIESGDYSVSAGDVAEKLMKRMRR